MSVVEGFAPYGPYQTWYRVTGDLKSGKVPLIVAHGGPGCTYDYVDSFKDIAETGRAVVHYDQIGKRQIDPSARQGARTSGLSNSSRPNSTISSTTWASATPFVCSASPGAACSGPNSPSTGRQVSRRW